MTETVRQNIIRDLQCKYGSYGVSTRKSLQYGRRDKDCRNQNLIITNRLIGTIYRYTAFDSTVYIATKIKFVKTSTSSDDVSITIGATTFGPYSFTGDGEDIAAYFYNIIQDNSTSPEFYAEYTSDTLYIYSYATSLSYATSVSVTSSNSLTTSTITTDDDNEDEILDIWNCVTKAELCDMIEYSYYILNSSDPCNC